MSDTQMLPPTRAMIGRWGVDRYISLLRKWAMIAAIIAAILVFSRQPRSVVIGWEIITVVAVGWLVARRDGGKIESLAAGAFVGVSLGAITTLSRYVLHPSLTNGLFILIETVLTTLIAALISTSTVLIINLKQHSKN